MKELNESYKDGDKVYDLLKSTLNWDAISRFKDIPLHIKDLYGKINKKIEDLKTTARNNAKKNA